MKLKKQVKNKMIKILNETYISLYILYSIKSFFNKKYI